MTSNKNYKGSVRLDWINKNLSLYYEIDEKEGRGIRPVWVPKSDMRVAEPRILKFVKSYGDPTSDNMLIKGDNLLTLRSLVEMFKGKPEKDKVKCIYIDPPYNTGNAFKYYDDNLQHSEWLTLMRDRLILLKKLLRKDGIIFVHIDYQEHHYLKVLLDEVFGRDLFVNDITVRDSHPSGFKLAHKDKTIIKTKSTMLVYKNALQTKFNSLYQRRHEWDTHFNIFVNIDKKPLVAKSLRQVLTKEKIIDGEFKIDNSALLNQKFRNFCFKNKTKIFQTTKEIPDFARKLSLKNKNRVVEYSHNDKRNFALNGRRLSSLEKSIQNIGFDGYEEYDFAKLLCDFWDDVDFNNTQSEGGVSFTASKKPEFLVARLIAIASDENDVVLDAFAGSGTTGAVAQKMKRRWIMVEIGGHADKLIIPRLQRVIAGKDRTGVTKDLNWQGGGGFKYYQPGASLIHEKDMNWILKAEEIAEAIFLHFQYKPVKAVWLEKENMYLGRHHSAPHHFALSFTTREAKFLTEDLYEKIIAGLDKEKFKHLTIFTNVAVTVPPESLDNKVLVRKIPAAILREYNLL